MSRRTQRILIAMAFLAMGAGLKALELPECRAAEVPRHCVEN